MFTGLIEHVGTLASFERHPQGARVRVHAGPLAASLATSNSIAVNGCCLTAVEIEGDTFAADLSGETLRRTTLGELKIGARVNLERPLTASKELGGHFVQGHVDGVGQVARVEPEGANWWLGIRVPQELQHYVAVKGSIAIDGISLTVAGWSGGANGGPHAVMEAAIIPFTYEHTNISALAVGDGVNLECDVLAKYVERILEARQPAAASTLSVARLMEEGF
jgi:riboflavin synthase